MWLCHSESSDLLWEVRTQTCYADQAVRKWSESHKDSTEMPYAVPYVLRYDEDTKRPVQDYDNLPTREEFFKERDQ